MQQLDAYPNPSRVAARHFPDSDANVDDGVEHLVVIELLVPPAAKVPVPSHYAGVARLVVREASVTSTVPAAVLTEFRANDTARAAAWRTTATLAVRS